MPRTRQPTGKSARGTSNAAPPSGASRQAGGKPKPPARPAAASKAQKRTRAKSATTAPVRASLKVKQANPKPRARSTAPKRPKKPKENGKVRVRLVNAALFLLLLLAVAIWAEIHRDILRLLGATLGTVTGLSILLSLLRFVPKKAISLIGETVTDGLVGILENPRITPYVASFVVLGLPLAAWDSYLHHRTYAVRIVLGASVLEFVQDTDVPPQKLFELAVKVARGGVRSSRPVTGPGPIYIGSSEEYLRWRHVEGSAEEDYKELSADHPQGWSKPPQFLPTAEIRPGDALEIELRCPHDEIVYKETKYVPSDKKLSTILLEPNDRQAFVEALNKCSSTSH